MTSERLSLWGRAKVSLSGLSCSGIGAGPPRARTLPLQRSLVTGTGGVYPVGGCCSPGIRERLAPQGYRRAPPGEWPLGIQEVTAASRYPSWTVLLDPGDITCLGSERWLASERECRSDSEPVGPVLRGHNGSVVLVPWAKERTVVTLEVGDRAHPGSPG